VEISKRDNQSKSAIFAAILTISLFFSLPFYPSTFEAEHPSSIGYKQEPRNTTSINLDSRSRQFRSNRLPSISVGRAPTQAVASDNQVYVVCFGDDSVWVVDLITKAVTTVIPVGALPSGISVSKDGSYVYVTSLEKSLSFPFPLDDCSTIIHDPQGGKVTVINTFSNSVESVIPIPGEIPFATFPSFDGKKLYLVTTSGNLYVIDLTANAVEKEIHLGVSQAENAVLSPDGQQLFVSAGSISNDIFVFNTLDSQLHLIPLDGTGCDLFFGGRMVVDPSGEYLFANALRNGSRITILISTSKEMLVQEFPVDFGSVSFSKDGMKAYLVSSAYPRSSGVVLNLGTLEIEKYLSVGGVATVLSKDELELYVLRYGGLYRRIIKMGQSYPFQYDITVVNLDQNTVIETPITSDNIWCSFERTLTSSSDGKYLIVTNSALNTVTVIQTRIIYAPLNFSGQKVLNRSLSQAEYINVLTWQANSNNENIGKYRIYQIEGSNRALIIELNADVFRYLHRGADTDTSYTYSLVAVNNEGREGLPAIIAIQ